MRWSTTGLVTAAIVIALGATGCSCARTQPRGASSEPTSTAQPTASAEPTVAEQPSTPTPSSPEVSTTFRIYLTRGETLSVVSRSVPKTTAVARASIEALLGGPLPAEKTSGYDTAIPEGTSLRAVSVDGGTATVDLSGAFDSGGGSASMRMRVAQVVYTLTQFPGVKRVAFEIDGEPVEAIGGEGVMVSPPVTRADFTDDILPPILVESPTPGQTLRNAFRLLGTSNTFEATFSYELTDAASKVVADGFGTATAGTGTWGTFDVRVRYADAASGRGSLVVYEVSAKDGSRINVVEIPVMLAP